MCKLQYYRHYNNAFYARVGGVSNAELNRLEMEFLFLLDFGVMVSSRVFESYCSHLEKEMMINGASQRIERAIVSNTVDDVTELSVEDTQSSSPPQGMDWPELLCLHFLFLGLVILVTLGTLSWTTFLFLQFLVLDMLEARTAGRPLVLRSKILCLIFLHLSIAQISDYMAQPESYVWEKKRIT